MARKKKSRGPSKKANATTKRPTRNPSKIGFLDLPPELRNQIYELALTLNRRGFCPVQLLTTCKQINAEATSYLYDNKIKIAFDAARSYARYSGSDYAVLQIAGVQIEFQQPHCNIAWPPFLRKARRISFRALNSVNTIHDVEVALHSLCSFLGNQHELRKFEVRFTVCDDGSDRRPDVSSTHLIDRPNLRLVVRDTRPPKGLWTDKATGLRCSANTLARSADGCIIIH